MFLLPDTLVHCFSPRSCNWSGKSFIPPANHTVAACSQYFVMKNINRHSKLNSDAGLSADLTIKRTKCAYFVSDGMVQNIIQYWFWLVIMVQRGVTVPSLCVVAMLIFPLNALATSPPTISPSGGLFAASPTVSLSAASGTIYYTTDGTAPNASSHVYSSAFTIVGTTTINAIAIASGVPSTVATATLTIDPATNPLLVDTTPILWLRSDVGVTADSSNKVSSWLDLSGNSNSASQSTSADQPSLIPDDYNGFPSIGTGSSAFFDLPSGFASLSAPNLYVVTKPNGTSNGIVMDLGNGTASDNVQASTSNTDTTFTINQGSTPASITASSVLNLGQYQLLGMNQASGTGHISINGALQTSGSLSAPSNTTRSSNHIGANYSGSSSFYDGNLLEAILFPDGIGSDLVETYLITRYQLLNAVPNAPIISVSTATLDGPTQVAIATPANCVCRFTTDGSSPSSSSPTYTGPINIYYSQTLKAIAVENGVSSTESSATYTLDSSRWPAPDDSDGRPLQINVQSPVN